MVERKAYPSDLPDAEWQQVEFLVPGPLPGGRPAKYERREILNIPRPGVFDWLAAALAILAFVAMQRFKIGIVSVIVGSGLAGLMYRLLLVD